MHRKSYHELSVTIPQTNKIHNVNKKSAVLPLPARTEQGLADSVNRNTDATIHLL